MSTSFHVPHRSAEQPPQESSPVDWHRLVAARRRRIKLDVIARETGIDKSQLSRIFSDQYGVKLSQLDALLDAFGLKVVAKKDARVVPEDDYQAMARLAEIGMQSLRRSPHTKFCRRTHRGRMPMIIPNR